MKTKNTILILTLAAVLCSCKEDLVYSNDNREMYTEAFIKAFGKPAENHTYNVAIPGKVTVTSSIPRDIRVLAVVNGQEYMFADYRNVRGREVIDFDIPNGFEHLTLYTNGTSIDANLGDVIDLDNPFALKKARSRADGDIIRSYERITFNKDEEWRDYKAPIDEYYGYVSPIDNNFHLENTKSAYRVSGWQLKNYFDRATTEYLKNTSGYTDNRVIGNTYTTSGCNAVGVMYWNKKADEDFELGLVYPQESDNNFNSGPLVYVPLYRTDESPSGEAPVQLYNYSNQSDLMGAEITIDFANKTQQVTSAKWVQQGFSNFYLNLFDDNGHLEALVEKQYNAQSLMLNPADYYAGCDPILPPYNRSVMNFYKNWDEFVYASLTYEQKAQMDEIEPLKSYFTWNRMKMPYEHVYPKVTRPDASNTRKYKIYYMTAQYCNTYGMLKNTGTKAFNIVDHELYAHDVYKIYPTDGSTKTYAYYVRNLNTGQINTTIDNDGKTIAHVTYIEGNMNTTGAQHIIEMDINGDGVYDDIVFYSNGQPVPTTHIDFTPYTWTIACEDLGNTDDWDFNDLVVQIQYVTNNLSTQTIKVWPMAAGGIFPIYLMYTDPLSSVGTKMIGTELHQWLGVDLDTYNTGEEFKSENTTARAVQMSYDINLHGNKKFSMTELNNAHWTGNNIGGFWVMVDKNNHYGQENLTPSSPGVYSFGRVFTDADEWGDLDLINTCARANDKDNRENFVPMVICVGGNWEWPRERKWISEAYPGWSSWIADPNFIWYGPAVKDAKYRPDRSLVTKRE